MNRTEIDVSFPIPQWADVFDESDIIGKPIVEYLPTSGFCGARNVIGVITKFDENTGTCQGKLWGKVAEQISEHFGRKSPSAVSFSFYNE